MTKTQKASKNELIKAIDKMTDRKKYLKEYNKEYQKTLVRKPLYFSFYGENNPVIARFMKIKGTTQMGKFMHMLETTEKEVSRCKNCYSCNNDCICAGDNE